MILFLYLLNIVNYLKLKKKWMIFFESHYFTSNNDTIIYVVSLLFIRQKVYQIKKVTCNSKPYSLK